MDWQGEIAVIVASGPSAVLAPLEGIRGRAKVIAVNESWKLVPWADILFGCDSAWWLHNRGVPEFKGQRLTASPMAAKKFGIDLFFSIGNNSGMRSIYLAERMGAETILLVGFDMHAAKGIHWHPPYSKALRNPGKAEIAIWCKEMERVGKIFARKPIRIINCTPGSALKCFPFMPLLEAMDAYQSPHSIDRQRHTAVAV